MTDETATEAKAKFDLTERLKGRGLRTGVITIYTDEVTGEKLGYARDKVNQLGLKLGDRERAGVLGEIDALDTESDTYKADLKKLEEQRDELIAELKRSALTFTIKAVPPVISKGHERQARKKLGIKGKPSEDEQVNLNEVQYALLYVDTITSIVDADGADAGPLDYDTAKSLIDYLPTQQRMRLQDKLLEVQFGDAIDESITSDADFSPAS